MHDDANLAFDLLFSTTNQYYLSEIILIGNFIIYIPVNDCSIISYILI